MTEQENNQELKNDFDDDTSDDIDLSKIKNWFKRKEQSQMSAHTGSVPSSLSSAPLNFRTPSSSNLSSSASGSSSDDLSFDWSVFKKAGSFCKAHPVVVLLLLLLMLQFVPSTGLWPCSGNTYCPWGGLWARLQAQNLPQADEWALGTVHNSLRSQIASDVARQYPGLPESRVQQVVEEQFQKQVTANKAGIDQQIAAIASQIRDFFQYESNGKKYLYMPDIDPYFWLRYSRNILDTGVPWDTVVNGVPWDNHMIAPLGVPYQSSLHPRALVWLNGFFGVFGFDLMSSAAFFPVVIVLLSLIPAFFVGRRVAGNIGGTVALTMLSINTAIAGRTGWGHADTDGYNVLFPLLITWVFLEAVHAKDVRWRYGLGGVTGFLIGVYTVFWSGWWYMYAFTMVSLVALAAWQVYKHKNSIVTSWKNKDITAGLSSPAGKTVLLAGVLLVSIGVFVTLFQNFHTFWYAPLEPFSFSNIKIASNTNLWPNVYTTVAELNPASFDTIVGAVTGGGSTATLLELLAVLGIVALFWKGLKDDEEFVAGTLLLFWLLATVYASTKGVRFTMLVAIPFVIAIASFVGVVYSSFSSYLRSKFKVHPAIVGAVLLVIVGMLIVPASRGTTITGKNDVPNVNDAWWNVLTKIKEQSAPNAIINSWWDFGHHFKYIANRAVTFDGASQNSPQAHWIGKVLLTSDEALAKGIVSMLDCGANTAFDTLDAELKDVSRSVKLLYEILPLSIDDAHELLLQRGISESTSESVLSFTHCSPPEDYFITSDDLIGKAGVWAHFGGWNFDKADAWVQFRNLPRDVAIAEMIKDPNISKKEAADLYDQSKRLVSEEQANAWISPWPGFQGMSSCSTNSAQGDTFYCGNGLEFNASTQSAALHTNQGVFKPEVLTFMNANGEFVKQVNKNGSIPYGVAFFPHPNGGMASMLSSPELAASMFTRLYLFQGQDLKYFKPFAVDRFLGGGWVSVWKLDWDGKNVTKQFSPGVPKGGKVSVEYIGWLDDGTVFDSSIIDWQSKKITKDVNLSEFENRQFSFSIGTGQVIPGFDLLVRELSIGQETTGAIPPEAAYGIDPSKHPLGNKTLNFKIKRTA